MRTFAHTLFAGLLLLGPASGHAFAVSVEDLVNLKANGLGDDVLVALIACDGSVFTLTSDDVVALKKRGLSDAVLVAMISTGKKDRRATQDEKPAPEPQLVVQQTQSVTVAPQKETVIIQVPVAVPVFVERQKPAPPVPPEYWGYGGKLRPGSWAPSNSKTDDKPDDPAPNTAPARR